MTLTVEQRLAALEAQFGDTSKTIDDWRDVRPPELSNQFYPVWKLMQQLFDSENSLNATMETVLGRLKALEQRPSSVVNVPEPSDPVNLPNDLIGALNAIGFVIKSDGHVREIALRAGAVTHTIANTENDRGFRRTTNFAIDGGWRAGSTHTDPRLGQVGEAIEQDNAWSVTFGKSDLDPNPNTAEENEPNDYDKAGGKSFVIRGLDEGANHRSHVQLGPQRVGVGWEFACVPKGGDPNKPAIPHLRGDERGVFIVNPDGTERKL